MKKFIQQIPLALIAGMTTLAMLSSPQPAQAAAFGRNYDFSGTVNDSFANLISGANVDVTLNIGNVFNPDTINLGVGSFQTDASGNFSFSGFLPDFQIPNSVTLLVSPTSSSANFFAQSFTVAFEPVFTGQPFPDYTANATLSVTPVPEPSDALATLAFGAVGAAALWKRKQRQKSVVVDNQVEPTFQLDNLSR